MFFGAAASAVDYFGAAGFECPPQYNPGDYLIGGRGRWQQSFRCMCFGG